MRLRFSVLVSLLVSASVLSSCGGSGTHKESTPPAQVAPNGTVAGSASWAAKMQALQVTLSDLLPLVASRKAFSEEANQKRIETDVEALRGLAHSLKSGAQPSADPSMKVVSVLFEEDIARALDGLRSGNRDYARHILKDTTSYCIQCHTQSANGPDFPALKLNIDAKALPLLDRAEFYASTRQFDESLAAYREALASQELAKEDPFEWEASARAALAITVRVKQDAKETGAFVTTLMKSPIVPQASKTIVKSWDKSVREWQKEKRTKTDTLLAKLTLAESLIARAQKTQKYPLDHSQDITYFRAASLLHDILQSQDRSAELSARTLYWAGVASEATRDMNFWTLHETFYEQCIRLTPDTEQARQCYGRLKDSITLGYSGSAGTQIPIAVSRRLEVLRVIADGVPKTNQ